ncbi:hypothetical protein ABDJ38_16775, partial [Aurantiacibacter sp. DGU5]
MIVCGQLNENLLASVSQHQRQKNGEQTLNRMRARALNGYWVFQTPIGYRYERVTGQGKVLQLVEPVASIVRAALEGFANKRFGIKAEVKRFLEAQPDFPRSIANDLGFTEITIAALLGHASGSITSRYVHTLDAALIMAA